MDQRRQVVAEFGADMTVHRTPLWWLAAHGLTNESWETEALADLDGDGMSAWQEYCAVTDPTDRESVFAVSAAAVLPDVVVSWDSVSGRLYTVFMASNIVDACWTQLPGFVDRPGAGGTMVYTNPGSRGTRGLYAVGVETPE